MAEQKQIKNEKDNKRSAVRNGSWKVDSGYSQVLFSSKLELRPVLTTKKATDRSEASSIQVSPEMNDLLFIARWLRKNPTFIVKQWNGEEFLDLKEEVTWDLWTQLGKRYPWTKDFIDKNPKGPSHIPYDDEPIMSKSRRRLIFNFLKKFNISHEEIDLETLIVQPKEIVKTDFIKVNKDFLDHVPSLFRNDENGSSIKEIWFEGMHNDKTINSTRLIEIKPNIFDVDKGTDLNYAKKMEDGIPLKNAIGAFSKFLINFTVNNMGPDPVVSLKCYQIDK